MASSKQKGGITRTYAQGDIFKSIPDSYIKYRLQSADGTHFGDVSYGAYKAVQNGTLDSYTPQNRDEETILSRYRTYPSIELASNGKSYGKISYNTLKFLESGESDYSSLPVDEQQTIKSFEWDVQRSERQKRINSDPVFKKYNIDPANFTVMDLDKWAKDQNIPLDISANGSSYNLYGKSDELKKEFNKLQALSQNNWRLQASQQDLGSVASAMFGAADGLSFGGISALSDWSGKKQYDKAGLPQEKYVSGSQMMANTFDKNKLAYGIGNIAGSVASTVGVGKIIGAGLTAAKTPVLTSKLGKALTSALGKSEKTVKWLSKSSPWMKEAIRDGIAFGITNGTRTSFEGGTLEDILMSSLRGGVSAAVGGGLSKRAEIAIDKLLTNPKYVDKFWGQIKDKKRTYYARNSAVGLTDAAGDFTADTIMAKITGTETRSGSDVLTDFAVTLLYGMTMTALSSKNVTQTNKAYIENEVNAYLNDYEALNNASKKATSIEGIKGLGEGIIARGNKLKDFLNEHIFTGNEELVKSINEKVDYVNGKVREDIETMAKKAGDSDNTAHSSDDFHEKTKSISSTDVIDVKSGDVYEAENGDIYTIVSRDAVNTTYTVTDNAGNVTTRIMANDSVDNIFSHREAFTKVTADDSATVKKTVSSADTSATPVEVGDTFHDTKTGTTLTVAVDNAFVDTKTNNILRVVARDAENTTFEIMTAKGEKETRVLPNATADQLKTDGRYREFSINGENTSAGTPAVTEQATTSKTQAIGDTEKSVISITKVGDFYEAYGDEALLLADKLGLTPTTKTINGEKVQMVGFPVSSLDSYKNSLGSGYNISVLDQNTADAVVANAETTQNSDITTTNDNIIDHTKEVNGLKLIDTVKSIQLNGQTLITGIYELNSDKDFSRKSYKKEDFDYFCKSGNPWTKTVGGTTYGHYAFYKHEKGQYFITHLPTGMGVAGAKTESKAKTLIKAFDDNLPELPINIRAYGDGYHCYGDTQEISATIKSLIESSEEPVVTEIQDGKVPFNTKAGLVDYVKAHIGDRVRVTFNNGASEVRTLESISNSSMRTKKPDGSDSIADLKGIKYNDNGFSIEYGTGVSVAYDFINTADNVENFAVETPESVTETKYIHLYDEEKVSKEYLNSVNSEIENAIISIRNGNADSVPEVINVTELDEKTIKAISDFVGYDVSEYVCKIERDRLVHIENRHGINGEHDQSLSDPKDTARMGYVVNNSDNIEWATDEKGNRVYDSKYNDRHNKIAPVLVMEKRIDGTYSISQVVPDSKKKTLWITSARIEKAAVGSQVPNADNSPQLTPETPLNSSSASDTIIAEETKNVNTSEETTTPTLTDKCELHETTHTKTGEALWVISLNDKITSDEYKALSAAVKKVGGYYSRFAKTPDGKAIPSFIFKSKPDADVINTFNSFFGTETAEETAPAETRSTVKEIDTEALLGAVGNAKVGDEIKLSDYEKAEADEQGLNNQPESDTMVSEKTKEDFKVGDILEFDGEQWKCVNIDSTMIDFENVDKNAFQPELSVILPYELFKEKTDYTVIKESAENVHNGILGRESRNDNAVREPEPVSEVKEKRNIGTEDRKLGEDVASENGKHIQYSETETSATGQLDSRDNNNRIRESDSGDGNSGTGIDGNDTVDVAENSSKSKDFVITKAVAEDIDKSAPSMSDNIKAIETLHAIEKSGKTPTKTQQGLLAKFKGWGGLAGSFFGSNRTKLQELMSESELKAAQSTVNDAYFTPTGVIDGMYKALSHLGFEGGNILEPSMGIGNFFGRMPKSVKDKSSLFGVEIDSISGRIAQQLYPSANIEIAPFQDVAYKDGAFDLIIGNVPFGEVKYSYKGKKYLIHDYFFVKAMDKLNDGGILMFLTTKGTLDKLDSTTRTELSNHGKLLGAYRLPSDVFTKSAGASVVTDLIIMQKTSDTNGESFINLGTVAAGIGEFSVNEYFVNHPENVIGRLTSRKDWRSGKEVLDVVATGNLAEQLIKAIRKLPKNLLSGVQTVGSVNVTENNAPVQTFAVTENDTVEYIDAATGDVKQIKGKSAKTAKDYVALKDTYQELVDATLNDYESVYVESKRKALNTAYDSFVKKHGALEDNKKLLSADNDFYKMSGLEVYDTKTKKIVKSEMFTKDTLGKRKPKKADSVLDALSISIGETGGVDVNRIADLTGVSESEAIKQLDDRIVYTPDGIYELNEVYLSGNVREKYDAVKGKKGFEKNEKMLEAVIPADIPAKDITPQFGSPWIKPDYVADFLKETLHLYNKPVVSYDPTSGTWSISGNTWGDNTLLTNKYGTKYMDAIKIAEKALNMRRIVVTDKDTKKCLLAKQEPHSKRQRI